MAEPPYQLTLPITKTKKIARMANQSHQLTTQAAQLLTFCSEYIVKHCLQEAEREALKEGQKSIQYSNLRRVVLRTPGLAFLEDTLPEKFIAGEQTE